MSGRPHDTVQMRFLGFLVDGPYYEYMIDHFDLNVDEE